MWRLTSLLMRISVGVGIDNILGNEDSQINDVGILECEKSCEFIACSLNFSAGAKNCKKRFIN